MHANWGITQVGDAGINQILPFSFGKTVIFAGPTGGMVTFMLTPLK